MTNTTSPATVLVGDQIDLVALLKNLWAQKWLIILVTFIVTIGAASYAFLSKPVYEARVEVLPPSQSDIAGFNLGRDDRGVLKPFSVDDIYAVFIRNLQAEDSRRQFFREMYLPVLDEKRRLGSQDKLYATFTEVLSVQAPTKSQPNRYSIVVEWHDPVQAAEWTKHYLDQVTNQSLSDMLKNSRRDMEVLDGQIQQEVKTLREVAKLRRNDRVIKLKEALAVAEAIGVKNPPVISGQTAEELSAFMNGNLMYMRGAKALRAEIAVLENRASDDPFIPSLRSLQEQSTNISAMQVVPDLVSVARPDGAVITPDAPIKPKKVLILFLGVLIGGMLGVLIALARIVLINYSATAEVLATATKSPKREAEVLLD